MTRWPFWRKTMLAGALWLLIVALAGPALDTPGPLAALGYAIGYGTLITGFYYAMQARDERNSTPADPEPDDEDVTR